MMENVPEKERKKEEIEFIARCLATVKLLLFPFPTNPWFSTQRIVLGVQSTPFIMTMPVSLTKDDPSCG